MKDGQEASSGCYTFELLPTGKMSEPLKGNVAGVEPPPAATAAPQPRWDASTIPEAVKRERLQGQGVGFQYPRPGLPEEDATSRVQRPHYWSSEAFGEPHGGWETEVQPSVHQHRLTVVDPVVVYASVGGAWTCNQCAKKRPAGQMHHCKVSTRSPRHAQRQAVASGTDSTRML